MATKSKAPTKTAGATRNVSKGAAKAAGKAKPKTAGKPATAAARKTAGKPAAKPAGTKKASGAVSPVSKAAKTAGKTPAQKISPAKAAPAGLAKSVSAKTAAGSAAAKTSPRSATGPANPTLLAGSATIASLPPPKPTARPAPVVSPKDLASAHEYLLIRSASRSEAPVMVDGKPLLTEEQLLAMPDSQYMNSDQLAFFRYRLQKIEQELLSNADETTEHLRETVIVPDPADRATIEEEHALELRTRDRERKLLKKVQASLQQIESGEYGFCEETGDPIGIPRLLARPTATLSLEAQQRREIKQKLFGD